MLFKNIEHRIKTKKTYGIKRECCSEMFYTKLCKKPSTLKKLLRERGLNLKIFAVESERGNDF